MPKSMKLTACVFSSQSVGLEKQDLQKLAHFIYQYNIEYRKKTQVRMDFKEKVQSFCLDTSSSIFSLCPQPEDVEQAEPSNQPPQGKSGSVTEWTPEVIDPNILLPALKSFLEQVSKSRSVTSRKRTFLRIMFAPY